MDKKEVKKQLAKKKKVPKVSTSTNTEVKHVLIILVIVLVVLALFYFITGIVTGDIKLGNSKNETETTIQYDQILAGESFNQPKTEYLVFYYDMTETEASVYAKLLTTYKSKVTATRTYTVNLGNTMNQLYLAKDGASNKNATKASELKLKDPTIIRFLNGKITQYIEGKDAVTDFFNNAKN